MLSAQKIFQALGGQHVFDAKRQYAHLLVHRAFHLTAHLRGGIAARRENQNHHARFGDGVDDFRRPVGRGCNIARSNPAMDAFCFNACHQLHGADVVRLRVADEDFACHRLQDSRRRSAFSRLLRMRSNDRVTEVISVAPPGGKSSADISPRLTRSATAAILRTGRTTRRYSKTFTTPNVAAKTTASKIMNARKSRFASAAALAKGTDTT